MLLCSRSGAIKCAYFVRSFQFNDIGLDLMVQEVSGEVYALKHKFCF